MTPARWLAGQRRWGRPWLALAGVCIPAVAATLVIPAGVLIVVARLDWLSALILLGTAPLIPFFMVLIGSSAEQKNRHQWRELARMTGHFLDMLQGLTTLKLFNASAREAATIGRVSDDYRRSTMGVLRIAFLSSAVLELFATLGIAMVAVTIGFRLYGLELPLPDWATLSVLDFRAGFFILLLAPEMYQPLHNLEPLAPAGLAGLHSGDLLSRLCADVDALEHLYARTLVPLPAALAAAVAMTAYLAGYDGALGLSLAAFLVATGVLVPLWTRHFGQAPGRAAVALEAQLRAAAVDGIQGLPELLVYGAAEPQAVRIDALSAALAAGYDTWIGGTGAGETGVRLSGGEARRVALARAVLRDAPILLLDEPTEGLDAESEHALVVALDGLAGRCSLLLVTHRPLWLDAMDEVIVLDAGRPVARGRAASLAADQYLTQVYAP